MHVYWSKFKDLLSDQNQTFIFCLTCPFGHETYWESPCNADLYLDSHFSLWWHPGWHRLTPGQTPVQCWVAPPNSWGASALHSWSWGDLLQYLLLPTCSLIWRSLSQEHRMSHEKSPLWEHPTNKNYNTTDFGFKLKWNSWGKALLVHGTFPQWLVNVYPTRLSL